MFTLATVTIPSLSGLPEDNVVNTFAIDTAETWDPETELGEVTFPISHFYNSVTATSGLAVSAYLSRRLSRAASACRIRLYDVTDHLDGSPHGSPFAEDAFTLGATTYSLRNLPAEMAGVLTLRAVGGGYPPVETVDGPDEGTAVDRPLQRVSGRLYVGPLVGDASDGLTTTEARPVAAFNTTLREAAKIMDDELELDGHFWCVWSRKDQEFNPITEVSTDDAWDVQRRRGPKPTARITLTI